MYSSHIRNRCYNNRNHQTPYESLTGKMPDMSKMQKFGSVCYVYEQNAKKLDDRAKQALFVGYDKSSPAFLCYFKETNTVKKSRSVKFLPDISCDLHTSNDEEEDFVFPKERQDAPKNIDDSYFGSENTSCTPLLNDSVEQNTNINPENTKLGKGARTKMRPKFLDDYVVNDDFDSQLGCITHYCYNLNSFIPQSYSEAISCDDSPKWDEAMKREMHALEENDTFDIVTLPKDRKAIKGKWVYTIKEDKDDNQTYKARFVAKGYSQIEGIDYHDTFSPTARMNSIRLISQISTQYDLELHQMDVKAAYLNAPIDCLIFVEQPEGFAVSNKNGEKLVLRLNKSLYGLKQSGRNWNHTLHVYLTDNGFQRSINEPCFYFNHADNVYLLIWVDDLLISATTNTLNDVKQTLENKFKMKDLGKVSLFLGIEFEHEIDKMTLSQAKYINKILHRFGMQDCKPKYTPCEMNPHVSNTTPLNDDESTLYRQIVGALIYVMVATRPDISFIVTKLSQYMSCPLHSHMTMAKHVLRYLRGTIDEKLCFPKSIESIEVKGFCDADWGNDNDRKSITGYCFKINESGPMISWKSRKQPTVALSSCEAEYMSLTSATQEGKYLLSMLNEILNLEQTKFTLFCDNQSAISLAKNPVKHSRSKHIDIRFHFIRNEIENDSLAILYVPTDENVSDIFTKPMSKIKLQKFKSILFG